MGQTMQLAFSPSGVFDFGQQRQKRGELHGNLGSSDSGACQRVRDSAPQESSIVLPAATLPLGVAIRTLPLKYRALNSPAPYANEDC
jgi:hypothetical protein